MYKYNPTLSMNSSLDIFIVFKNLALFELELCHSSLNLTSSLEPMLGPSSSKKLIEKSENNCYNRFPCKAC